MNPDKIKNTVKNTSQNFRAWYKCEKGNLPTNLSDRDKASFEAGAKTAMLALFELDSTSWTERYGAVLKEVVR